MKIGILTTRTTHHQYFIYKICKNFDNLTIIYELEKKKKKEKLNLFEKKRDIYEKKIISKYKIKFNKNLLEVKNINDNKLADYLKLNCDFLVVFGTTKIKGKLLKYFTNSASVGVRCLNCLGYLPCKCSINEQIFLSQEPIIHTS